jgi:hypothetical protein
MTDFRGPWRPENDDRVSSRRSLPYRFVVLSAALSPLVIMGVGVYLAGGDPGVMVPLAFGIGVMDLVVSLLIWRFAGERLREQGMRW